MKRKGNILEQTASNQNIILAWLNARRKVHEYSEKKSCQKTAARYLAYEVELEKNLNEVQEIVLSGEWHGIFYKRFKHVECSKMRDIAFNDSVRDSVIQYALNQTAGVPMAKTLIRDTYSGIKNRGTSVGRKRMVAFLSNYSPDDSIYILKFDIHHYYDSINNEILKSLIARKIKDNTILKLYNALIDSFPHGLPIGNYLSLPMANFYLSPFDHFVKDDLGFKHYARYCDDVVIIHKDKQELKQHLPYMLDFLDKYDLHVKPNIHIFPIERHGIDFLGYVFKRDGVYLRKRIERHARRSSYEYQRNPENKHNLQSILSYYGWAKYLTKGGAFWNTIVGKSVKDLARELKELAA